MLTTVLTKPSIFNQGAGGAVTSNFHANGASCKRPVVIESSSFGGRPGSLHIPGVAVHDCDLLVSDTIFIGGEGPAVLFQSNDIGDRNRLAVRRVSVVDTVIYVPSFIVLPRQQIYIYVARI